MTNEFTLRIADSSDVDSLVNFNRAMAKETEGKELALEVLSAGVDNLLKNSRDGFYVIAQEAAGSNKRVIGSLMVTYEWSDWRNGYFWWIQSVYVLPDVRRRGVYRRLYEFVKELASSRAGVCGFRLYVEKENHIAQRTYEQLGMEESHYLMYEELGVDG